MAGKKARPIADRDAMVASGGNYRIVFWFENGKVNKVD